MNRFLFFGITLIAGILQGVSIAPSWGFLQILSCAVFFLMLYLCRGALAGAATGLIFGMGWMTTALSWTYVSIHDYGGIPSVLAAGAVLIFCAFLSMYPTLMGFIGLVLRGKNRPWPAAFLLLVLPGLWTVTAWMRATLWTGFGWGAGSYAHLNDYFFNFAPFIGGWGIELLNGITAGSIVWLLISLRNKEYRNAGMALILPVLIGAAGLCLPPQPFGKAEGELKARLIQGGVGTEEKFSPMGSQITYKRYLKEMNEPGLTPGTLIVLPETIFPVPVNRLSSKVMDEFLEVNKNGDHPVIFGGFLIKGLTQIHNSAVYSPKPGEIEVYEKRHLVPFGEFVPYGFRWFVDALGIPMADQSRGKEVQKPFVVDGKNVAASLCYEDLFPEEIRAWWKNPEKPNVLINLSNLGWFGDTIVLPQHLGISRMRAKEFAIPIIRATNTGMTGAIDAKGEVIAVIPKMVPGYLDVTVPLGDGTPTFYARTGEAPILWISLFFALTGGVLLIAARRKAAKAEAR